jgi:hypothetical protein
MYDRRASARGNMNVPVIATERFALESTCRDKFTVVYSELGGKIDNDNMS